MTDQEFDGSIRNIRAGDRDGLKAIYEAYHVMIYSAVYEILQNRQNAEDVASDYFIKLWDDAEKYRMGGHHRAWMLTVARNMAIDFVRRRRREIFMEDMEAGCEPSVPSHEDAFVGEMSMRQALEILELEEREILNLKILGQLTFKEVARILKKPMGTVTWKYQAAVNKLKRCGYE